MEKLGMVVGSLLSTSPSQKGREIAPILNSSNLPAVTNLETDRDIPDRVVGFWQGFARESEPLLRRELTVAERSSLEARLAELQAALAPYPEASKRRLCEVVSGALGAFPAMQRHSPEAAISITASYLWTMRGRPHWAIEKVCEQIRSGRTNLNLSFCPSEPEFNQLVGKQVQPYAERLALIQKLLNAKTWGPEPERLTRAEIAEIVGRDFTDRPAFLPQPPAGDGKHAQRVLADIEARKSARQEAAE